MTKHHHTGKRGEEIAASFLEKKGYAILKANWRYNKAEIDLLAEKDQMLVIVEVKTRTSAQFELPKEAVTIAKQKHLIRAANAYIEENNIDLECRFDIISILLIDGKVDIEHVEDAFQPLL